MSASFSEVDEEFYAAVRSSFLATVERIAPEDRRFFSTEPDEDRLRDICPLLLHSDPSAATRPSGDQQQQQSSDAAVSKLARSLRKAKLRSKKTSYSDLYIQSFPADQRQELNCCFCRRFIDRFGSLVTVDDATGRIRSLMWHVPVDQVPDLYREAVAILLEAVESAGVITNLFTEQLLVWGIDRTTKKQDWSHLSVATPPAFAVIRAFEKAETQLLRDALVHFKLPVIEAAVALLEDALTNAPVRIQRPDIFQTTIDWFLPVGKKYATFTQSLGALDDETKERLINHFMWSLTAQAPGPSFTHIKNNMSGELLAAVIEFTDQETQVLNKEAVVRRMNGEISTYREQTAGPSEQQLAAAQAFLTETGLEKALEKQFALPEDIPNEAIIWRDESKEDIPEEAAVSSSVQSAVSKAISQVQTKSKPKSCAGACGDQTIHVSTGFVPVTWRTFVEKVLPDAESVQIKWPANSDEKLFSIVGSKDSGAPVLHKWGNNFSWSYKRGGLVPGETRKRVREAGGAIDDCPVRCSLIWETFDDLDLDVIAPSGERIYYSHRKSECGGELDTDANGQDKSTDTPVENIRWKTAPIGTYVVKVIAYGYHTPGDDAVDFNVEIEVDGNRFSFEGAAGQEGRVRGEIIQVATIDYRPAGAESSQVTGCLPQTNAPIWGHGRGSWQAVKEIFKLPNSWPARADAEIEKWNYPEQVGFSVRGCQNVREARAWLIETLVSVCKLHERALQAIGKKIDIAGGGNARKVCGVGESFDAPTDWNTTLKVKRKSDGKITLYHLDRME